MNQSKRTEVRTAIKRLRAAVAAGDKAKAQKLVSPTMSAIDVAIRNSALKENTANRYKSRLYMAFNAMK